MGEMQEEEADSPNPIAEHSWLKSHHAYEYIKQSEQLVSEEGAGSGQEVTVLMALEAEQTSLLGASA